MDFIKTFQGGDMRSPIGSQLAASYILENPNSIKNLMGLLTSGDKMLQMRAADCLEKVSLQNPQILYCVYDQIIHIFKTEKQKEIRWHMAQILPRIVSKPDDIEEIVKVLFEYMNDNSKIVATFALDALANFAKKNDKLKIEIMPILIDKSINASGAIKARAIKLLKSF